ncbi:MAG: TolC family protein [Opitutaceae bacterium]
MNKITASAALALSLMGFLYSGNAAQDGALTLPEDVMPQLRPLVEAAMRQSPRMLERNLDLTLSKADAYMARASSLPQIGGNVQYQWQRETRADAGPQGDISSNNEKFYYNFAVNQGLWHWGALQASRKIARIDQELAAINYGEAYRGFAAEVRSSYMGLVLAKIAVNNAAFSRRMAEENLARQQARYSANQITYGQIMSEQLRLDEASLAEQRARADFEFTLASFRSFSGDSQFAESDIPDVIADVNSAPAFAASVASSAAEANDRITAAEKDVERAKLGLVAPRYALFPKLSLLAGVSRDEINRDLNAYNKYQTDTWYAGAQINWTIFDGFSSRGQKLAAYTRLRRAEQRLTTLRESLVRDQRREEQAVTFSWQAYQNAKLRLRMAREGADYFRELAKRGEASQEQVDSAVSNMNSLFYLAQQALAAHLSANVQYVSSRGLDPLGKPAVQH